MLVPEDYAEWVYVGILGKIIGVYLGRPFEGWTYEQILAELGEIDYYVNDRIPWDHPLVVTDDDITGTFTFLRALSDYGNAADLTPAQIGQTWLNYIIENRTILWWGGFGNSTEHTAYLRLKGGIKAPEYGSMARNGRVIAEQIGAQIFIDGWAMVSPGDPALAADLARRAASVSHDGKAIYAAQVLAAMEAQAFFEADIDKLIDCGVSFIPRDSVIYRMIADIRDWHAAEPDWHAARARIAGLYNYENYGGNCHMVPNHALILLGLLFGEGDFNKSMRIVNTAGWDTDCNSGNLGCLLGIKDGLSTFDHGKDWRGPVGDRLYLPTADGGRAVTDAVIETQHIINIGRVMAGARFHFALPGSVQGFHPLEPTTKIENESAYSHYGRRSLAVHFQVAGSVATPTFILPEELKMAGYQYIASPTLYSGQTVAAGITASGLAIGKLFFRVYNQEDALETVYGPAIDLKPHEYTETSWRIPDTQGQPIAEIGLALESRSGTAYLDYLTWSGAPETTFTRPFGAADFQKPPLVWRRAWVNAVDQWGKWWPEPYRLIQNEGRGLLIQGTREWTDYRVEADIKPWLMDAGGIAARVQGLRRFYGLLLTKEGKARLVKALDGDLVLAEVDFAWENNETYQMTMEVVGANLRGWINGQSLFQVEDVDQPLMGGGVAYVVERGHLESQAMRVSQNQ